MPLIAYNVILKLIRVTKLGPLASGLEPARLLFSDVAFNLGFALLWLGGLALHRKASTFVLMHISALVYVIVTTSAHRYFLTTGTVLDAGIVAFAAQRYDEVKPVMASETPWLMFATVFGWVCFGPIVVTRLLARGTGASVGAGVAGLAAAAGVVGLASSVVVVPANVSRSVARDPLVHLVMSAPRQLRPETIAPDVPSPPRAAGRLLLRENAIPKNVVVVVLESTGAWVTNPYEGFFAVTPFLGELSERSLVVERAYTTIPHTSKALVSIVCGIEPRPTRELVEAQPGGIPATCLPELFEGAGYRTIFFESATEAFENRRDLVRNFGFQEFIPGDTLDTEGFEPANYFGVEDAALLAPSRRWLEQAGVGPFLAIYLTNTAHHQYLAPRRYGRVDVVDEDEQNRYLNAVRYQDFFLRDLYRQYEELELIDSTIFLIVGDHGEAFGEHVRKKHDDVPYEETARVPMVIVGEPVRAGTRVSGPASLIDLLPTAADAAGFELVGSSYPGQSLLRPLENRVLWMSCFNDFRCVASVRNFEKYIHFFGDEPDALFDLSDDPFETSNLAAEMPDIVSDRRRAAHEWRARMLAVYR